MIRVLYVDDEEDIRTIVDFALRLDPDFACRLAGSVGEARAVIAEGWRPDIVMVDVMMPGEGGGVLLQLVKDDPQLAAIPVVLVTASAQARDLERYREAGADGVIRKPFDPLELASRVRGYLR
ncbi:MAG TPA: response regulator [Novosphingobium sp.]